MDVSLILEALNRARREQQNAVPVPSVDSEHFVPPAPASSWPSRALLLALALALLVIGVLLSREFSHDPAPAAAAPLASPPEPALAAARHPAPEPAAIPLAASPVTRMQEAPPELGLDVPAAPSAQDTVLPAEPVEAPAAQPATNLADREHSAEVAALYEQAATPQPPPVAAPVSTPTPPATREDPVDIASLVTAVEQALEDVRLAEHPAPFLGDLSQQRKDAVPTLMYLQHDYRSSGGSTVTINSQRASAGQTVGRGVRVEEILSDSVVLSHDGQQFRLRALNSWVNL